MKNGTNDWKMQVTPLSAKDKLNFGIESSGMRLADVNTSFISVASSHAEHGNPMKRSQILTKPKPAKNPNLAKTLPSNNYNTQQAPVNSYLQGRQSEYCTLKNNHEQARKKSVNFWSESITETEKEQDSQRETSKKDLHSSSLMNNKNNSIADIIMTTPSFDPGSKVSAAFLENSNDNSGIQLKNFSLGAATNSGESVDMVLSPSQASVLPNTYQFTQPLNVY